MTARTAALAASGLGCALIVAACSIDNPVQPEAELDEAMFRCRVEPMLVERCGFPACHGSTARAFVVYGPNRLRLDPGDPQVEAPLTQAEHSRNFAAAVALTALADGYDEPLIVEKPLAESLGGAFHGATRLYGGTDPFTRASDDGLVALRSWLAGAREEPTCQP